MSILVLTLFLFSSGALWAQVPSYVPKDGLLGWWPFNGNTNDESGNGNHGNAFKIVFNTDRVGSPNQSIYMSGNDSGSPSYIEIPSSNSLNTGNTSFTWSFWVRTNAVSTQNGYNLNHAILSKTRAGSTCDGATIFESKGYWGSQTLFCNPGVNNYGQGTNVFTNDDKWLLITWLNPSKNEVISMTSSLKAGIGIGIVWSNSFGIHLP